MLSDIPSSFTQRLKTPPRDGGGAEKMQAALIENGRIGVKLAVPQTPDLPEGQAPFEQNYIGIPYMSNFGPRLFMHGRELFKDEDAYEKFRTNEWQTTSELFRPEAMARIEKIMRPESFDSRIMSTCMPRTRQQYGEMIVTQFTKLFPKVDFSGIPTPTEENAEQVEQLVLQRLEASGVNVGEQTIGAALQPSQDTKQMVLDHLRANTEAYYTAIYNYLPEEPPELRAKLQELKEPLMANVAAHGYDPIVYENFMHGLMNSPLEERNMETLIERGVAIGACRLAVSNCLSQHMGNPFGATLRDAERHAAQTLAQSVHPRTLKHAIKDGTAFVVVDDKNVKNAQDILAPMHLEHEGRYERLRQTGDTTFNDIIVISSPRLRPNRIAVVGRHEAAHLMDLSAPVRFEQWYAQHGKGMLERDAAHLQEARRMVDSITPNSPAEDIQRLRVLAKKLKLVEAKEETPDATAIGHMQKIVSQSLDWTHQRAQSFMPAAGDIHVSYGTNNAQINEVPAVMEELTVTFGRDFPRALFPETYPAAMRLAVQHPAMRNPKDGTPSR